MKYQGNDNSGKPKADYVAKLAGMADSELLDEAKKNIWLSAYARNNPRSDYHWRADACYDESQRRGKPEIYQRAYDYNVRSA